MNIEHNKVVQLHYTLTENNQQLETTKDGDPVLYLHGHNNMLAGIENGLEGKQAGDSTTIVLEPKDAYGEAKEAAPRRIPRKHILTKGKLKPEMIVDVNTTEGPVPAKVLKVGLKTVDVDTNHPYAGKTLTFEIEVIDVRDASQEEINHGHAHGIGGHNHN